MSPLYRSFAKVNLHLQVVGTRSDGYRELRTVFQTIDLHDLISVEVAGTEIELEVEGADLPCDDSNLAFRAAALFASEWAPGIGVKLRLVKRIPVGGGLGGGSSNAATVLRALQEQVSAKVSEPALRRLAGRLGADVPYFLVGGTALGLGRGDKVVPLPELPRRSLWLAVPPHGMSTGTVFRALGDLPARPLAAEIVAQVQRGELSWEVVASAWNDLEAVALSQQPSLRHIYNALVRAGAGWVRLTGSGAVLVAAFAGDAPAQLREELSNRCRIVRSWTLSRQDVAGRRVVRREAIQGFP